MHISTHTSLAGRDPGVSDLRRHKEISTHTSLAGRDTMINEYNEAISISTHTSLAGRDHSLQPLSCTHFRFLLTRPSRDVTMLSDEQITLPDISTHTSLAGRDYTVKL